MVSRVPVGVARDRPVDSSAVGEQSEEQEGTTWLLESQGGARTLGKQREERRPLNARLRGHLALPCLKPSFT